MTDPMEPVKKLMEQFTKEIEPLGLHVHTFALLPNPDGPPHGVQVMLTFDGAELAAYEGEETPDGDVKLSPEEKDLFEMMERDITRSAEEEKAAEAAEALKRLQESLESGTGILGEEET